MNEIISQPPTIFDRIWSRTQVGISLLNVSFITSLPYPSKITNEMKEMRFGNVPSPLSPMTFAEQDRLSSWTRTIDILIQKNQALSVAPEHKYKSCPFAKCNVQFRKFIMNTNCTREPIFYVLRQRQAFSSIACRANGWWWWWHAWQINCMARPCFCHP